MRWRVLTFEPLQQGDAESLGFDAAGAVVRLFLAQVVLDLDITERPEHNR